MLIIIAHVCVADLDQVMIPYVDIPCDETTNNSHVIIIQYNDIRYNDWVTRVNEAR